ncbi:FmdB family zinc ribbon protein [Chloroflexota bacterium]
MPFYNFFCSDCLKEFELQRSVDQRDDLTKCPACEGSKVSRTLSLPAVYSRGEGGEMRMVGSSSSCGGCTASSCSGCSK